MVLLKGKHGEKISLLFFLFFSGSNPEKNYYLKPLHLGDIRYNQKQKYFLLWAGLSDDVDRGTAVFGLYSKPMAVGLF